MDWDKLRVFHTVADCGSFTHAGERLRLSQSAVSRQIRGLEEDLKVSLFHRHARGLTLTQEGEMLFGTARDVVAKICKDAEIYRCEFCKTLYKPDPKQMPHSFTLRY